MKYFLTLIVALILSSCISTGFVNTEPRLYRKVFHAVNSEMRYKLTEEWTIPPLKKGFLHDYREGSCTNYAMMYRLRLNQAGIPEGRMRFKVFYACAPGSGGFHAVLVVDSLWVLNNMSRYVTTLHDTPYICRPPGDRTVMMNVMKVVEGHAENIYFDEKKRVANG